MQGQEPWGGIFKGGQKEDLPFEYLRPGAMDGPLGFSFPSGRWRLIPCLALSQTDERWAHAVCTQSPRGCGRGLWIPALEGRAPVRVRGSLQVSLFGCV